MSPSNKQKKLVVVAGKAYQGDVDFSFDLLELGFAVLRRAIDELGHILEEPSFLSIQHGSSENVVIKVVL